MAYSTRKSRLIQNLSLYLAAALLLIYFGYHAYQGDNGLKAQRSYAEQVVALEKELAVMKAARAKLEHRVSLLKAENLDPDMLDERARAVLNYAHPHDIVILTPNLTWRQK
jgi:cell division protein FtsB